MYEVTDFLRLQFSWKYIGLITIHQNQSVLIHEHNTHKSYNCYMRLKSLINYRCQSFGLLLTFDSTSYNETIIQRSFCVWLLCLASRYKLAFNKYYLTVMLVINLQNYEIYHSICNCLISSLFYGKYGVSFPII